MTTRDILMAASGASGNNSTLIAVMTNTKAHLLPYTGSSVGASLGSITPLTVISAGATIGFNPAKTALAFNDNQYVYVYRVSNAGFGTSYTPQNIGVYVKGVSFSPSGNALQ